MAEQTKIKLMSSDSAEITVGVSCFTPHLPAASLGLYCIGIANFRTDRDVAERSVLIKNMMDDIGEQAMTEAIPIPNVSSRHLVQPLPDADLSP